MKKTEFENVEAVAVVNSDSEALELVSVRAEISSVGFVGGGFDNTDIQLPFIGVCRRQNAGKLSGSVVCNKDDVVFDDGESAEMLILASSDVYYQECNGTGPNYAPKKFQTLEEGEAAGLTLEWTDGPDGRVPPSLTKAVDFQVLMETTRPCGAVSFNGKSWVRGLFTAAKIEYDQVAKPYATKYVAQYKGQGYAPWQLVWKAEVADKIYKSGKSSKNLRVSLVAVHKPDSDFVREFEEVIGG